MKRVLITVACVLGLSASLQAGTSYAVFNVINLGSSVYSGSGLVDGGFNVSPYTGTIGGANVELFSDELNDGTSNGATYNAYATALNASPATLAAATRYGDVNVSSLYPAGTQLYEEMAWLATQMMAQANSSTGTALSTAQANDKAIQEAIWTLTYDSSDFYPVPHNSGNGELGSTMGATDSTAQGYLNWISDAEAAATSGFAALTGYATLVTGDWYVVTAVSAAGCTIGSEGGNSNGCTPGTPGDTYGEQEFLAYDLGDPMSPSPEPASFALFGVGFSVLVVMRTKRRHS